jgi:hypothetical protein
MPVAALNDAPGGRLRKVTVSDSPSASEAVIGNRSDSPSVRVKSLIGSTTGAVLPPATVRLKRLVATPPRLSCTRTTISVSTRSSAVGVQLSVASLL